MVGLAVLLIFKISGRGIMDPDVPIPLDTRTLVPSSKYLIPTLQGFLKATVSHHLSGRKEKPKKALASHPVTGSTA